MKYLKIKNWDKWQTFRRDRGTPGWIKVWRNLFTNKDWAALTDQEKGQLISMWLVAADQKGKIPNDPQIVQKICQLDQPPNLIRFKELGWLDGQVTDTCQPYMGDDCPSNGNQVSGNPQKVVAQSREEESRGEKKTIKVEKAPLDLKRVEFEILWKNYPEKKGKHDAWMKFKNQVITPKDLLGIKKALVNYKEDMVRIRIDHPDRAWLHGSTWFNNRWKDFIDYQPPPSSNRWDNIKPEAIQ